MSNEDAIEYFAALRSVMKHNYDFEADAIDCIELFNKAVDALEKAEKYRWHDLRKNPEDLPEVFLRKELWFGGKLYSVGCFDGFSWDADLYRGLSETGYRIPVIAWREIEPFEEEEWFVKKKLRKR